MNNYDYVIAGGGTAGCAAAYIAAKYGASVLLVEKNIHLGGTMTSALVVPGMHTSKNQINKEFFNDLIDELNTMNAQVTYENNPAWFNPELLKIALDNLLLKVHVDILFNSRIEKVNYEKLRSDKKSKFIIKNVIINSEMLSVPIAAKYFIDATGNCEIGVLANCKFLENENEFQPVSLRFEMSGIDVKEFSNWLLEIDSDRNVTTSYTINGQTHLSTAYTWDKNKKWALAKYFDDAVDKGIIKDTDRNYFQVFSIPNMPSTLAFNCPRICTSSNINPLDPYIASSALIEGRQAILRIADFCKIYFPGFKNSYISNIADMLGIRVSRRIEGKYVYTVDDLRCGKKFKHPVLISDYPIDVHSNKKNTSILESTRQEYQFPVESLIAKDFSNLFVIGRCISADFMAQAALRIQPSCFSMGEGLVKFIQKGIISESFVEEDEAIN